MGRGKRSSAAKAASKVARKLAKRNARIALVSTLCLLGVVTWFVVIPIFNNSGFIIDWLTGEKIVIGQGVKVTGVAVFANDTAINGQTIRGMDKTGKLAYIATLSAGSFTTNRGPAEGGTFDFYMSISGCILYVGTFEIPASKDYSQESYNIGQVLVFPRSQTFVAMVIGSTVNTATFTAGTGTAGTVNYTMTAGVDSIFTLRLTNTPAYSRLFRQYTDPRSKIAVRPVLWVEVARTTVYCNGITKADGTVGTYMTWANATSRMFICELEDLTCLAVVNQIKFWSFKLNSPTTGIFRINVFVVDGSYMNQISLAQSRVSDPATLETVTAYKLVNSFITVS